MKGLDKHNYFALLTDTSHLADFPSYGFPVELQGPIIIIHHPCST